jgi:hypothetical protein
VRTGFEKDMRFRDLPALHFTPQPYTKLQIPETAQFGDLSISPDGHAYWSLYENAKGSTILDESGRRLDLHAPQQPIWFHPIIQKFLDGRWLIIEARTGPSTPNAFVFNTDGTLENKFFVGDGIQTALLDQLGKIWIGYFDEGIFGAFSKMPPKESPYYRYGPSGLIRTDDRGKIEFAYNEKFPNKLISDIESLTLDDKNQAWFCPYTDFFVASAAADDVTFVLPRAPTSLPTALSVGPHYFAFFGGYHQSSMVALVDRLTLRVRLIQLHDKLGGTLSPIDIATRGARAIGVAAGQLYHLDQDILLRTLGPWTENNSASLASAIQYIDEEESYAGEYQITRQGAKFVSGPPRPADNKPRNDDDTGN